MQTGETAKAKDIAQKALVVYDDSIKHYHDVDADTASDRYDMDEMLYTVIAYGMETGDYALTPLVSGDGLEPPTVATRMEYGVMQAPAAKDPAAARARADALLAFAKTGPAQGKHRLAVEVDIAAFVADGETRIASGDTAAGLASLARAAQEEATAHEVFEPLERLPAEETYGRSCYASGASARPSSSCAPPSRSRRTGPRLRGRSSSRTRIRELRSATEGYVVRLAGGCCTAQRLPSGSSKNTNCPDGSACTSEHSMPRLRSSLCAAWASLTTSCKPAAEPGALSVSPWPIAIEQPEPGGVSWMKRMVSLT